MRRIQRKMIPEPNHAMPEGLQLRLKLKWLWTIWAIAWSHSQRRRAPSSVREPK